MFATIRRLWHQFFNRSRTINNEPLNRVSLIVIILIDIFILINVFTGLNDISQWHLSPSQAYPCYAEWQNYRTKTTKNKEYEIIKLSLQDDNNNQLNRQQLYQQTESAHLGKVSPICLQYAADQDKLNNSQNQQTLKTIEQKQNKIITLKQANDNIRAQYDSTLLEKIAGQPPGQSINQIGAEKAKQVLDQNNANIATLEKEIASLQNGLLGKPESTSFIALLQNEGEFVKVKQGYQQASFWYPSIQLALQSMFLLPLILIALFVHRFARAKGYGLISLMSWHLLVIFMIPLVLKIFEFLQVGVIFQFLFNIISAVFGSLLFLVSYLYILLVPLIGFVIIKFFQKVILNPQVQAVNRVQQSRCFNCAKKIRQNDAFCPHCGYYQYVECQHCHELTYKHLPYCKHCGNSQETS
ncbi:hypothetical protein [Nostoc sp. TCL26-01]|uniref:hypothetical protein n=1 Tax=Nostoc sp. TCL26-01 TaxID=2576904 RepID=UPI0015C17CC2|nr:hypothetical protein [Nostoc sp. TCL26-01]QLE59005.1 hypothetical protein FD725_28020 [Nostoc sp. TCL26-01]